MFILGASVCLLAAFVWFSVAAPPTGVDNARHLLDLRYILDGHLERLAGFQLPVFSTSVSAIVYAIFDRNALLVASAAFTASTALICALITFRLTGSTLAGIMAALIFSVTPLTIWLAVDLRGYALMNFLGYAGMYLLFVAIARNSSLDHHPLSPRGLKRLRVVSLARAAVTDQSVRMSFISGALVGLSALAWQLGLLFIPAVLLISFLLRAKLPIIIALSSGIILPIAPWVILNFNPDNPLAFWGREYRWIVTNGYLALINRDFWGHGIDGSGGATHLADVWSMFSTAFQHLAIIGPSVILAAIVVTRSLRGFAVVVVVVAIPVASILLMSPAPFARYLAVVPPAVAIGTAIGIHYLLQWISSALRGRLRAHFNPSDVLLIMIILTAGVFMNALSAEREQNQKVWASGRYIELQELAGHINDERAVIGGRPGMLALFVENRIVSIDYFLNEPEFVTYMTWRSDEEIASLFESKDVGWVILQAPVERWEIKYHGAWMLPTYGILPQHTERAKGSPLVEPVFTGRNYHLYRVTGVISAEDGGPSSSYSFPISMALKSTEGLKAGP